MTSRTAEYEVEIGAPPDVLFDYLDSPLRLSMHMNKSSWMMLGTRMTTTIDSGSGQTIGSIIEMRGNLCGVALFLHEAIIEREPPFRKSWETIGEQRLLIIDGYVMGFDILPQGTRSLLRIWIRYTLPKTGIWRLIGGLLGPIYARWCVRRMADDARAAFAVKAIPSHVVPQS